jgi:hypothetical protein
MMLAFPALGITRVIFKSAWASRMRFPSSLRAARYPQVTDRGETDAIPPHFR